jgi:hypothetical protein
MGTKTLLSVFLALSALNLFGQVNSEFNFRFLDDKTGIKVMPLTLEVRQRQDTNVVYKLSQKQIAGNGTALVEVPAGTYDVRVTADWYEPMATYFTVKEDGTVNATFSLVPTNKPFELSPRYLSTLRKSDAMVIAGYVVNDFEGAPMDSVFIFSADKSATTYTDFSGYFQLIVPLPENKQGEESKGTIYFKKKGFTTEVLHKFDMWPMGDMVFKVRLKTGKGTHKTAVLQKREPQVEFFAPPGR